MMRGIHIRKIHLPGSSSEVSGLRDSTMRGIHEHVANAKDVCNGELHAKQVSLSKDSCVKIFPSSPRSRKWLPLPQSGSMIGDLGHLAPHSGLLCSEHYIHVVHA